MNKQYRVCPYCGCNLDPGEKCDCENRVDQEPFQETADLTTQSAPRDECKPVLMTNA